MIHFSKESKLILSSFCLAALPLRVSVVDAFRSPTPLAASSSPVVGLSSKKTWPTALSVLFGPGEDKDYDKSSSSSNGLGVDYMPLDDLDDYCPLEGVTCDPGVEEDLRQGTWLERNGESLVVFGIPGITPFLAFFGFDHVAAAFHWIAEVLSTNNWVSVDGGTYQAKIIAPAINGVVIPSVALLLATLTSTTITTLRQRQLDVRKCINIEAAEIRAIEVLLDSISPGHVQDQCRDYLIQYTCRILDECHPRQGAGSDVVNPRRGFDSELNGLVLQLNNAQGTIIPPHVASECYQSLSRLREQRSNRITALQSVYPVLHYAILLALTSAIMTAFLIETDQELLVFLNALQLKLLWSMLSGTFVACFAVFLDLRAPFSGSYQVSDSVDQLHTIKWTLQASRVMSEKKREQAQSKKFEFSAATPPKEVARLSSDGAAKSKAEPKQEQQKKLANVHNTSESSMLINSSFNTTSTSGSSSASNSTFE